MSKFKIRRVTGSSPDTQRGLNVGWAKQQVEIFRVASNSGIMAHRIGTSNQEFQIVFEEKLHYRFIRGAQALGSHYLKCAPDVQDAPIQSGFSQAT
jgi:hypothetical protein